MQTQKINFFKQGPIEKAYLLPVNQSSEESFEINGFLTIGRDDCNTIPINDPFVSARHIRIEKRDKGYLLRDMQSRNGTFLNGTPVVEAYLSNNDTVMVGESLFIFSKLNRRLSPMKSKNKSWNLQLQRLPAIANTDYTVLIIGPSGSGKEIISHWIHEQSQRKGKPYITINCSALSESLIESELFGHLKGSFTGSFIDRKGAFEAARGGTLFLDEIGDLPLSLQPKLLRALENREIRPVGSDVSIKTNVRIIAATHKNLKKEMIEKKFREDLYHRLNICRVTPPPLVGRMEDFDHLIYEFSKEQRVSFTYRAIEKLKNYSWPGNIRELKNVITRGAAYFPGQRIDEKDLDQLIDRDFSDYKTFFEEDTRSDGKEKNFLPLQEAERSIIISHMKKHFGNQRKVSMDLEIPKSTLFNKLKIYNIEPATFKKRNVKKTSSPFLNN